MSKEEKKKLYPSQLLQAAPTQPQPSLTIYKVNIYKMACQLKPSFID